MVCFKRFTRRAAGYRVHHRGLYLEESLIGKLFSYVFNKLEPGNKLLLGLIINNKIHIPLAKPCLCIFEPMPLFRKRQQRLGKDRELSDLYGILARPCFKKLTFNADNIPYIQLFEQIKGIFPKEVLLHINLHFACKILYVRESALSMLPFGHDPARDSGRPVFRGIVLNLLYGFIPGELLGIGIYSGRSYLFEVSMPLFYLVIFLFNLVVLLFHNLFLIVN